MATSNSDGPIKISKRIEKELHQTKVVVRKLPPDLTEEKLLEKLSDVPEYSYFYFAPGDSSSGAPCFSRAYFAFTDEASILSFRDKYDGWYLESESGVKYRAVVEFAPYQGIPKRQKRKPDARVATIEQDADYRAFLEAGEVKLKPPSMAELSAYIDTIGTSKTSDVQKTPLIDYLIDRRSGRSGKRQKSSSDSKKRQSSKPAKDSRKDIVGSSRSKELKSKKDGGARESRDRPERRETESAKSSSTDKPDRHRERSSYDKRGHEENGEVKGEGERKSKEFRVKNRDRPDQAIYTPRGKQRNYDEGERPREREGSHRSSSKDSSEQGGRSGRGSSREYYNSEERPRRGYKDKRYDGGRRDDSRKSKDSYGHENTKSHSSGHRER